LGNASERKPYVAGGWRGKRHCGLVPGLRRKEIPWQSTSFLDWTSVQHRGLGSTHPSFLPASWPPRNRPDHFYNTLLHVKFLWWIVKQVVFVIFSFSRPSAPSLALSHHRICMHCQSNDFRTKMLGSRKAIRDRYGPFIRT